MTVLTVVTVVKDDAEGFESTLRSLPATAPDVELVVVDGSADRAAIPAALSGATVDVAYSWSAPRGVYAAMNDGLATARGRYVYFLNAGDTLDSAAVLPRLTADLGAYTPGWAFGRVRFRNVDGTTMSEPEWSYPVERARLFARGRFPAHQGVVAETDRLREQGGFDLSYRVAADYLTILRLALDEPPLRLDYTLAEFSAGGLSTTRWRLAQSEFHRARRQVFAPRGYAAARELTDTWAQRLATETYRALWAPGRPLHGRMRARSLPSAGDGPH